MTLSLHYDDVLVWFRRDLRDYDHAALSQALQEARHVHCAFVFDTDILDRLLDKADRRVEFIWESVRELQAALRDLGGDLLVLHGPAKSVIPALAQRLKVQAVYANRDYEPPAVARDAEVARVLEANGIAFLTCKDQVVFESDEVLSGSGRPYSVFTPYKNAWLKRLRMVDIASHGVKVHALGFASRVDRYDTRMFKPGG